MPQLTWKALLVCRRLLAEMSHDSMETTSLGITVEITGAHLHILQMGKLGEERVQSLSGGHTVIDRNRFVIQGSGLPG